MSTADDTHAPSQAAELRRGAIPAETLGLLHDVFTGLKAHVDKAMEAGFPPDSQAITRWPNGTYGFEQAFRMEDLKATAVAALKSLLNDAGLAKAAHDRLGPDFVVCLVQSMFRWRPPHKREKFIDWHQDGKFYGAGIRSMNVWLPMTPCGRAGAPGLEYIDGIDGLAPGQNYMGVAKVLTDGYADYVATLPSDRIQSPDYEPGDVLLFNQDTIHRTTPVGDFTAERVSLEMRFLNEIPNTMVYGMNLRSHDLRRIGVM